MGWNQFSSSNDQLTKRNWSGAWVQGHLEYEELGFGNFGECGRQSLSVLFRSLDSMCKSYR